MNVHSVTSGRAITGLNFHDIKPATIDTAPPEIRQVRPTDLYVDESYQRGLSERSVRLIRKIVSEWSWRAFKPPVVVDVGGRLEVIDGQHTAIGAVTHGGIDLIPVLVVEADSHASRASAFVRHNKDRIQVTPTQLHNAMVAAGDNDAIEIHEVCTQAGVKILRNPPPMARFKTGECLAVAHVGSLIKRRGRDGAIRVLETCVKAGAAPVALHMIKAVECLIFDREYRDEIGDDRIAEIMAGVDGIERDAKRYALERKLPFWRAFASVIFINRTRRRGPQPQTATVTRTPQTDLALSRKEMLRRMGDMSV